MAENHSKNGANETDAFSLEGFEDVDWGGDTAASESAPSAQPSKASPVDDDDPFASSEDFGGAESFFEIEQMPNSATADDGLGGDDFGDLSSDGFDAPALTPAPAAASRDEDPFADDPFSGDSEPDDTSPGSDEEYVDDPFAAVSDGSAAAAAQAQAQPTGETAASGQGLIARHRNLLMGVVGVAAAAVAVVYGGPMFMGGGDTISVNQPAPIQTAAPAFPTTLPPDDKAGQEVAAAKPVPAPVVPATPVVAPPAVDAAPSAPELTLDLPAAPAVDVPQAPIVGGKAPVAIPVMPKPAADPIDDLVGGSDRGGIDAVKSAPVELQSDPVPSGRDFGKEIDALVARLDGIEDRVVKLADGFDNFVQAKVESVPSQPVVQTPAPVAPDAVPPLKPPIIESASLKGVAGELAWISTKSGTIEAKVGDTVPNAGKVVAIRNYRDQWIVVTTDGLIVRQ